MGMKAGGGGGDDLNSEINVTPMVDVMLVLLIIFMITAPMMNSGVDIELPQVTTKNVVDPEKVLILSIGPNRKLSLSGGEGAPTPILWKELETKLKANALVQDQIARKQATEIYIEADAKVPYGVVVTAMALAKNAGITKVMMLTDPGDNHAIEELDKIAGH